MPDNTPPVRWEPDRSPPAGTLPRPPLLTCMRRGMMGLCPACGQARAFAGYLKVVPECPNCGTPLGSIRADDAPPYFVIFIVGHIVVTLMFMMETHMHPPLWVHAAVWIPVSLILALALLRPVKGATLGMMLRFGLVKTAEE